MEVEVRPVSPFRLGRGSTDRTLRIRERIATRFLHVDGSPVLVRAWEPGPGRLKLRAQALDPRAVRRPLDGEAELRPAGPTQLRLAIERMRFALGVDDDISDFHRRFRRDPLLGPLIRRLPSHRPLRKPWPWEALATAVVGQLIEADRAALIERRIIGRWGARLGEGPGQLRDVPGAATIAGRAPAELAAMDLAPVRAAALRRVAITVQRGCPIDDPAADRRLLSISQIGPWTVQCLGLYGRGESDSLPAGDLAYIKLVGHLAGLGRRATVPEVEEFYAPYAPYRGLAGTLTLAGLYGSVAKGRPLPLSPEARAA
jgi:DNA-3-methyladenine glycosylase II